ncbi:B-box zinc finger protein 22 [Phoenix dactylifera]|uniref:B-box zinc finger protein 22 n=1 Tax=Phoenix dactylifera TaxID=42345 RepID=A0A8B7C917_PHODC|nr:B-box zinc finger protein 22 [Phoenix dactylifera]
MKIQCNACEAAEATVLCCADEAALCWACDEKVHAANKLAGKHQRVPLLCGGSSPRVPNCDICQEASGYFFCLEDRALLCRKCDVAIHTANPYVSAHQRFLITGVQVGLEPTEPVASFVNEKLNASEKTAESPSKSLPKRSHSMSLSSETNEVFSSQVGKDEGLAASKMSFSGVPMPGSIPDWPLDEFFGFADFSQNFGFTEHGSSKADSAKLGSSEGSPVYRSADEELDADRCLGQVPEIPWAVPEIPSPPTASGLHWQRNLHYPASDHAAFVPDICSTRYPRTYAAVGSKRCRPC